MNRSVYKTSTKLVVAASFGGALEIYDLVVYTLFAPIISQKFFPSENEWISLLGTFGVLAIGYIARPLGGMIYSHYGDRYGRKTALIHSLLLMSIPTFLIGLLPTYETSGILAPLLLTILRILQGISIGGDLPGAITFIAEHAPPQSRGLLCGWVLCGANLGSVLCAGMSALLIGFLNHTQLLDWGWRIPFLFGIVLGGIGLYLRQHAEESPIFKMLETSHSIEKIPLLSTIKTHTPSIMKGIGISWIAAAAISTLFIFMPTYLVTVVHVSLQKTILIQTGYSLFFAMLIPIMGTLSDKIGRKPLLIIGTLILAFTCYPLYYLLNQQNYYFIAFACFSILTASIIGSLPSTLAELFSTEVRYSGVAVSYNMSFSISAGIAPLIALFLLHATSNIAAPSFYIIISAALALPAMFALKETSKRILKKDNKNEVAR